MKTRVCDNCEKRIDGSPPIEVRTPMKYIGRGGYGSMSGPRDYDFCSPECAIRWVEIYREASPTKEAHGA